MTFRLNPVAHIALNSESAWNRGVLPQNAFKMDENVTESADFG